LFCCNPNNVWKWTRKTIRCWCRYTMTSVLSMPNTRTCVCNWNSPELPNVAQWLNWLTYGPRELTSDKNTIHSIGKISFPASFATVSSLPIHVLEPAERKQVLRFAENIYIWLSNRICVRNWGGNAKRNTRLQFSLHAIMQQRVSGSLINGDTASMLHTHTHVFLMD